MAILKRKPLYIVPQMGSSLNMESALGESPVLASRKRAPHAGWWIKMGRRRCAGTASVGLRVGVAAVRRRSRQRQAVQHRTGRRGAVHGQVGQIVERPVPHASERVAGGVRDRAGFQPLADPEVEPAAVVPGRHPVLEHQRVRAGHIAEAKPILDCRSQSPR